MSSDNSLPQNGPKMNCPQCGRVLESHDEDLWCDFNKSSFTVEEVTKNNEWRALNVMQKVERFKALGPDEARGKYFLQPEQLEEAARLVRESGEIRRIVRATVEPEKASLISLARGIPDGSALCELIDNAIDAGKIKRPGELVTVEIRFDPVLRTLTVNDDAGGMNEEDMRRCFTLGAHKLDATRGLIGRYGIGAKEAIYHFGREVIVRSRLKGSPFGLRTVVPEDWLKDPAWTIDIQEVAGEIEESTTSIEIGRVSPDGLRDMDRIRLHLGHIYERLIGQKILEIIVEGEAVREGLDYVPLFPPEMYPRTYVMRSGNVEVNVRVMLIHKPAEASGMLFYAQGRRFAHLQWSDLDVRMIMGKVQKHTLRDHIRVEVDFEAPNIEEIPINANKDAIRSNPLLNTIAPIIVKVVNPYFKCIPPLSQDGAMSLVNKFTSNHPEAIFETQPVLLGRVSDRTAVPHDLIANVELFKEFLRSRLGEPPPQSPSLEPQAPPEISPGFDETGSGHDQISEGETDSAPGKVPTKGISDNGHAAHRYVTMLLFEADSPERRASFDAWVRSGRDLGVSFRPDPICDTSG